MHIHILGICGTFMGSLAQLACAAGHRVTGCDSNVYPPMSTQLEQVGIELIEGFQPEQLQLNPDMIVVGNVVSRGNPLMEAVMERGIPYTSGPQWMSDHLLQGRWVMAVAGTHGKTTTSSMLAWILEQAGMAPGYLIGGVPANFSCSARLGDSDFFVIEADEYDTAFFDKRSKFVHYRPRTLVLNNLEYDHADIFPDLAAIQRQFHHLIRTVPANGQILTSADSAALEEVLEMGCWSEVKRLGERANSDCEWQVEKRSADGSHFCVYLSGELVGEVSWGLRGDHNLQNALAALAAARHVGVTPDHACEALASFKGVKRRLELLGEVGRGGRVKLYDDFAHHPTAITSTLEGVRAGIGSDRLLAIIEPRSNTMKLGVHKQALADSVKAADESFWYQPGQLEWQLAETLQSGDTLSSSDGSSSAATVFATTDAIVAATVERVTCDQSVNWHLVIMSNGGFENIHQRLLTALQAALRGETAVSDLLID
ncbi:UDP-N-acetylmuramate:L-alanyl-gamma-D-glutamyl-meso-diaminopimelate ligase [Teredinibacter waterburyi]|jgi:UDP-N-acetylmuramate:L-alanyl-gamma-D-glutamyl-meso-diaminopimelate ligase|uniref:UDP-N-acetylmuramate:L-alanyl-gamma-D-glutamyl- meso-diaminopimelate ligase n=1 Tax=Teredinibacter waterburyi TaxID=1500538 RepID=UPI00165EC9CE|nr:UDP-N-acetylmuramate:L-alanyl-gamma-D-glutamyl-meso-diaminopimelate ligase [Teredinibacter waterburyi]